MDTPIPVLQDEAVGFFDDFPTPAPPRERPRVEPKPWSGPPAGWLGGSVPWRIVLARSEEAYAVLRDFEVFPSGLGFSLVTSFKDQQMQRHADPGLLGLQRTPRFGVVFADGRKAVAGPPVTPSETEPNGPILRFGGGGGSGGVRRMGFWLWPLPPPGPLTWVAQWPDQGISEHSVVVDATDVAPAAAQAEQLWLLDPAVSPERSFTVQHLLPESGH